MEGIELNKSEIKITNKNLMEPKHKSTNERYEYYKYKVTNENEESQLSVAIYEIPPQKANYPYHYHNKNEEVFYIISGEGILETPDGNKPISAGDIIFCPSSEMGAHKIINSSVSEMLVYLDCDSINYPEIVGYPESQKIGVFTKNKPGMFYKEDTNVAYYEGE